MRVTVFASSSPRTPEVYLQAAAELGRALVVAGHHLITGAGKDGAMAALANAALAAGGRVDGVILRLFHEQGHGHPGLSSYLITDTMRERKRLLGERADAFIALPGGPGTWEELWEVAVERQIGTHTKPLFLLDVNDFWAGFRLQLARAARDGLLYGPPEAMLRVEQSPAAIVPLLAAAR